jgi:Arc/MetJ-type ribon-helix-helix transcriptional regulator
MSTPVTARLDDDVVEALDAAVAAGLASTRGAVVAAAVREWLAKHGEETIVDSYRRRYALLDPGHDELVSQLATFSVAACFAASDR